MVGHHIRGLTTLIILKLRFDLISGIVAEALLMNIDVDVSEKLCFAGGA